MLNSLIIGDTSQLGYYFPNNYDRISSRNIDFSKICSKNYDRIYLLFAEQRTFLDNDVVFFNKINVDYTLSVIDKLKDICNNIIIYSTSELWNNIVGEISVDMNYNYNYTPYIKSKEILCNFIELNKEKYNNVIIIYPFNFNSPHRKEGFLFSKIFKSIINREKISVGDLNINRDIIHPSIIVKNSIETKQNLLIGGGELINLGEFIKELYSRFGLDYNSFVETNYSNNLKNVRKEYYSKNIYSSYNELLDLTCDDIKKLLK